MLAFSALTDERMSMKLITGDHGTARAVPSGPLPGVSEGLRELLTVGNEHTAGALRREGMIQIVDA